LFEGDDTDVLLQRGGELLLALEHVAAKVLRLSIEQQSQLSFDCQDFKMLREEELRLIAQTAAERVERTGLPFALNPMNARERRIVHLALQDRPGVRTESEGFGPQRKVVIRSQKQV
jgi:spoIIIJ-associated protein